MHGRPLLPAPLGPMPRACLTCQRGAKVDYICPRIGIRRICGGPIQCNEPWVMRSGYLLKQTAGFEIPSSQLDY